MTYFRIGPRRTKIIMRRNEGFDEAEAQVYLFPSASTFPSPTTYPGTGA